LFLFGIVTENKALFCQVKQGEAKTILVFAYGMRQITRPITHIFEYLKKKLFGHALTSVIINFCLPKNKFSLPLIVTVPHCYRKHLLLSLVKITRI
jgi:hypothetical protein